MTTTTALYQQVAQEMDLHCFFLNKKYICLVFYEWNRMIVLFCVLVNNQVAVLSASIQPSIPVYTTNLK